jgi:16S rRNA (cytosine1402-N4)-methyltransferase
MGFCLIWEFPLINLMLQRGFLRFDAELDMRMSQNDLNAYKVVNEYDETNLKRVFLDYGELKNAPVLARTIVEARVQLMTTDELKEVLAGICQIE